MVNTIRNNAGQQSGVAKFLNAGSSIASLCVGLYSGIFLLTPLALSAAVGWLGWKFFGTSRRAVVPSFSVQAGHMLWLGLGMVLTGTAGANLIDIAWLGAGLGWLIAMPGRPPLYFLAIYQVLALAVNALAISQAPWGTTNHKALLIHIIWRLLALGLMTKLFLDLRRRGLEAVASA